MRNKNEPEPTTKAHSIFNRVFLNDLGSVLGPFSMSFSSGRPPWSFPNRSPSLVWAITGFIVTILASIWTYCHRFRTTFESLERHFGSILWFRDTLFEINSGSRQVRFGINLSAPSPRFAYHFGRKMEQCRARTHQENTNDFFRSGDRFWHTCVHHIHIYAESYTAIDFSFFLRGPQKYDKASFKRSAHLLGTVSALPTRYTLYRNYNTTTTSIPHHHHHQH